MTNSISQQEIEANQQKVIEVGKAYKAQQEKPKEKGWYTCYLDGRKLRDQQLADQHELDDEEE